MQGAVQWKAYFLAAQLSKLVFSIAKAHADNVAMFRG
jgi:hypothetical protein